MKIMPYYKPENCCDTVSEYKLPYRVHLVPLTGSSIETNMWACNKCWTVHMTYNEALECLQDCQ